MTIKKAVISTSILMALGLSLPGFAETKVEMVDGDTVTIECITQAEVDLMTDEDKANLKLPVCEDKENAEGAATTQ